MTSDDAISGMNDDDFSGPRRLSKTSVLGFIVSLAGLLWFASSGLGYNLNFWELGTAFDFFLWGAILATVGALVSLGATFIVKLREKRGLNLAISGIVVGLIATGTFLYFYMLAVNNPPIHDITTDFNNPPQFQELIRVRKNYPNPSDYGGPEIARQQKNWFPEIGPLELQVDQQKAYDYALQAARNMSWWKIQATHPDEHMIEATSTIPWFGFKDDIVIRVTNTSGKSRIDVRSVSRIGKGDLGMNARRIKDYLGKVRTVAGEG